MKKLLVLLAIVFLSAASYAQGTYKVIKIVSIKESSTGEKETTRTFPDAMYLKTSGSYVTLNDQAHSIYKKVSEFEDHSDDDYRMSSWDATDENNRRVMCTFTVYKESGDFWFTVSYDDITIMYNIDVSNN